MYFSYEEKQAERRERKKDYIINFFFSLIGSSVGIFITLLSIFLLSNNGGNKIKKMELEPTPESANKEIFTKPKTENKVLNHN